MDFIEHYSWASVRKPFRRWCQLHVGQAWKWITNYVDKLVKREVSAEGSLH